MIPRHSLAYHSVNVISPQTDIYPSQYRPSDLNINDSLGVIYLRSIMISLDSIQTAIPIITPKEGMGGAGCVVPRMAVLFLT